MTGARAEFEKMICHRTQYDRQRGGLNMIFSVAVLGLWCPGDVHLGTTTTIQ